MGTGTAAATAMGVANTQMKANFSRQVHVGALPFKNVARGQVAGRGVGVLANGAGLWGTRN